MIHIENQHLKIAINSKGAELTSIYHKGHRLEYLWGGDPAVWGKHSPLLFPVVGTLKDGVYQFDGKSYSLGRHGFARELDFEVEDHAKDSVALVLRSDSHTRELYPFDFELRVIYQLAPNGLATTYQVKNPTGKDIYFSIGGHPAFRVPLAEGTAYTDYFLEFETEETAPRWPISAQGLIETTSEPLLEGTRLLPLTKELFSRDALVFKGLKSTTVTLQSNKTPHGLEFDFADFPYLGIWAAKGADFVCIEPWCGIADSTNADGQLTDKEGIEQLPGGEIFERTWTLSLF
jgi:galactose mutarotase-like enzyme